MNYDGQTIEITNWDKYNPKRDQNTYSWLRLNNDVTSDPKLFDLGPAQRWAWIALLCEASKNNSGLVHLNYNWLEWVIGLEREEIAPFLDTLARKQMILIVKVEDQLIHGRALNDARSPIEKSTTPTRRDERDETNEMKKAGNQNSGESETSIQEELENDEEAIEEEEPQTTEKRPRLNFEPIYQEYPRKDGKQQGLRICKARIKTQEDYDNLLCAVRRYRAQCEREGTEKQFIKHFSTFMHGDKWKDWLEPDAGSSTVVAAGETDWSKVFAEDSRA